MSPHPQMPRKRNRNRKRKMVSSNPNSLLSHQESNNKNLNRNGDEEDEPNSPSHNWDFLSKGVFEIIDDDDDDDDVELQRVLFHSCSDLKSPNDDVRNKNKGVQLSSPLSPIIPRHRWWGGRSKVFNEAGESSVAECVICKDTKSSGSVLRANNKCLHPFCEDCIKNYVGQKLRDDILQIKCPEEKCNQFLEQGLWKKFVPERLDWLRDQALIEASVLENPYIIRCPSENCRELIVDDGRKFPIRACPNCWKIYCAKCMAPAWHKGMTCDEYRRVLQYQASLGSLTIVEEQVADPFYVAFPAGGDKFIFVRSDVVQSLDQETFNLATLARSRFQTDH